MPGFPIVEVPEAASERPEYVGSKPKFWYTREDGKRWLYKENRPNTGEDWSEKIAAELCALLGLPHATYELAVWRDKPGVVTRRIDGEAERLVLGNEVLAGHVNEYPRRSEEGFYRIPQYTLSLTLETLGDEELDVSVPPDWPSLPGVSTAAGLFAGYLLLDAWIGNTDRHDKNWALLERLTDDGLRRYLAPTFDHASSLGRELGGDARQERLSTRDRNRTVAAYLGKARSAFFKNQGDKKTMHVRDAFLSAAERHATAATAWLQRLASITDDEIGDLFSRLPSSRISQEGINFAEQVLRLNRDALLGSSPPKAGSSTLPRS